MLSMTGFGEARVQTDGLRVEVRMRGVNHRYLDLALRVPEELRPVEAQLREAVARRLSRGRVEVHVELQRLADVEVSVAVDRGALAALVAVAEELLREGSIAGKPTLGDLARYPELLQLRRERTTLADAELELILGVVDEALVALVSARRSEGAKLAQVLEERLAELARIVAGLESLSAEAHRELEQSLRRRLAELQSTTTLPEERIAQEVVVLLERSDVREELDRLQAHITTFGEVLGIAEPGGKRLDFLAQEILRELNTLAAKCRNSVMVGSVIDGKLICEQLREQVQNVE